MATEGRVVAAAIFWMKARAGWREKQVVEVTARRDVRELSDAELMQMIEDGKAERELARERAQTWAERPDALEHDPALG